MRVVIQRVNEASVKVENETIGEIQKGLVILTGIEDEDSEEDANWLVNKICQMRIFDDADGVMNLSLEDIDGNILAISQFTLHAKTKKGNRPSYIRAAGPEKAEPLFNFFVGQLSDRLGKKVSTGQFGAHMNIMLDNEGPVTIIVDTKNKE
ncbi:MAG: D-tyrosyl-tRNA(Tyr) deacylase [Salinivirgaceae bacterium]|nr:MAG: D-tyrosyl-tRNA(Tyr) deacylase [Salinivirgaceae bacterium]